MPRRRARPSRRAPSHSPPPRSPGYASRSRCGRSTSAGNRDETPATRASRSTGTRRTHHHPGPDGGNQRELAGVRASRPPKAGPRVPGRRTRGACVAFGAMRVAEAFSGLGARRLLVFAAQRRRHPETRSRHARRTVISHRPRRAPRRPPRPRPRPDPVEGQSVGAKPVGGQGARQAAGQRRSSCRSIPSVIKHGTEVDTRKGKVEITALGRRRRPSSTTASSSSRQSGGITILTLTEKLTGCPKAKTARAAAKKPKTRKLWGDGKGKFRTRGQYSAATIRGTKWLVQDTCTTTLTGQPGRGRPSTTSSRRRRSW